MADNDFGFIPDALNAPDDGLGFVPDAPAPTPEPQQAPSYGGRLAKAAGLGLQGMAQGAAYGAAEAAARPVGVVAGSLDFVTNAANVLFPVEAASRIAQGDFGDGGSFMEQVKGGVESILSQFSNQPVSQALESVAPGATEAGLPYLKDIAEARRGAVTETQKALEANKAAGGGGFGLDVATGLAQISPGIGAGLITRSPAAAAGAIAAPIYGQTLAEGDGDIAQRAARAGAMTGAEFVTELPFAKMLAVPAKTIFDKVGKSGFRKVIARMAGAAGLEGAQEAATNIVQDLYDRGALGGKKSLEQMLTDAGYAGLVGAVAGGVAGTPAAIAARGETTDAEQPPVQAEKQSFLNSLVEQKDAEGNTFLSDPAGNYVADTLEEASVLADTYTPEEIQQRMTPANVEQPVVPEQAEPAPEAAPPVEPVAAETAVVPQPASDAAPKAAAPELQQPANITEETFDVEGNPQQIREAYGVTGGIRIKKGLRFPRKRLPEFERRVAEQAPIEQRPLETEDGTRARDNIEERPGAADLYAEQRPATEGAGEVGGRTDSGRMQREPVGPGGVARGVEGSGTEAPVVGDGRQPDAALTEPTQQAETPQQTTIDDALKAAPEAIGDVPTVRVTTPSGSIINVENTKQALQATKDRFARMAQSLQEQVQDDTPLEFPEMTRPLERIKVKRPAVEAKTGKRVMITQNADEAVRDVQEQIQSVKDFVKCLRA